MNDSTRQIVNIPLLRKAVEWAEVEAAKGFAESRWWQEYFVMDPANELEEFEYYGKSPDCGTCYCIAGWVADQQEAGAPHYGVGSAAREILGLTEAESHALFEASNSIEDVRRIAERIAGERL